MSHERTILVSEHVLRELEPQVKWVTQAKKRILREDYFMTQKRFRKSLPQVHRNNNGRDNLVTFTETGRKTNICVVCFTQHGRFTGANQKGGLLCTQHKDCSVETDQHREEKEDHHVNFPPENVICEEKIILVSEGVWYRELERREKKQRKQEQRKTRRIANKTTMTTTKVTREADDSNKVTL